MQRKGYFIVYWDDPAGFTNSYDFQLSGKELLAKQMSIGLVWDDGKNYRIVHGTDTEEGRNGWRTDFTIIPKALVTKLVRLRRVK